MIVSASGLLEGGDRIGVCIVVGCNVTQNIGMNMLTSRVHDAWCLDVADRHRGHVVMMKMFVESRQTTHVLS